jgi:starch-binding outer membrane protein, SusD/RagB family
LPDTTASDQASLLTAILNERRHELFGEWGNRWFDLKRTKNIDAVMSVVTTQKSNGTTAWHSYQQLYPIPVSELQLAPNVNQNDGY